LGYVLKGVLATLPVDFVGEMYQKCGRLNMGYRHEQNVLNIGLGA